MLSSWSFYRFIMNELLQTERAYCGDLKCCIEVLVQFILPLSGTCSCSSQMLSIACSNESWFVHLRIHLFICIVCQRSFESSVIGRSFCLWEVALIWSWSDLILIRFLIDSGIIYMVTKFTCTNRKDYYCYWHYYCSFGYIKQYPKLIIIHLCASADIPDNLFVS